MRAGVSNVVEKMCYVAAVGSCLVTGFVCSLVAVDCVLRKALGMSVYGSVELAEYGLLWLTFLGGPWVTLKGTHIKIDFLLQRVSARRGASLKRGHAVAGIVISILYAFLATLLVLGHLRSRTEFSGVLSLPKWPVEAVVPIGYVLMAVAFWRWGFKRWMHC